MHNMKMLDKGRGICKTTRPTNGHISVILDVSRYTMVFFKLSKIFLPS